MNPVSCTNTCHDIIDLQPFIQALLCTAILPPPKIHFFPVFLVDCLHKISPGRKVKKKTKKFKIQVSRLLENAFLMLFLTAEA